MKNALLCATATLFVSTVALAGEDSPDCYGGDEFECAAEAEVVRLTNLHRTNNNRSELELSGHMGFVSRDWSDAQAARGSIGHDGFPSQRNTVYVNEFGSMEGKWMSGENVAYFGGGRNMTPEEAGAYLVQMWWNSSGHRQNMLGNHAGIGAGVVRTSSGAVFGTQLFYKNQ
jgi:uncharacterized protein YkwD